VANHTPYPGMPQWVKVSGIIVLVLILVVAIVLVTGAGGEHGPGRHSSSNASEQSFDRQFIDMMVPHHEGAIEMAKIAQQRAEHAEIRELAAAIIRAQDEEIRQMKAWRKSWFGSDQTPPMSRMPMVPGMAEHGDSAAHGASGTVNMAQDVEKLRGASAPFDRAFIDAMIPHHESAIEAARAAETRAQKQELKELARAIIADQQREIDLLRQWRQAWYGNGG
jgi:uncharacterized protein (DUF305 family)